MPKAYSLDLRERVARFVGSGRSRHAAAAHFKVSVSFVVNLMKAYRMTGSLEPNPVAGGDTLGSIRIGRFCWPASPRGTISPCRSWAELAAATGTRADPASISRWLIRNGYRFKKTPLASEQDRPDVRQAREEWTATRQPRMRLEPHRLVFLDETGTTTKMTRLRGRCLKGQRLRSKVPFGHWKTQTFIAGLRCHGLTAPFVVDAADPRKGRCRHHGQLVSPQKPGRREGHKGQGRMDPVPAALQPRPQSDRDGLRKTQSPSARQGHQDHRRPLAGNRPNLRPVRARRMQKLLRRRRISIRLSVRCSRAC